jgi:ABC-type Mn2+/Zn2+ transport system ATPase subunit
MLIELRGVQVGYHKQAILPPLDLVISAGTLLGVVGPNGSGKTTVVRTILGLLPPVAGSVHYRTGRRPWFGYVPQRDRVDLSFPLTALEVVLMGRYRLIGRRLRVPDSHQQAARRCLARSGIGELAERLFHSLSGGQRQRVLIARALAAEPEILMLDEPTTGMDLPSERSMLELVAQLGRELGLAVVMVSHQLQAVANYVQDLCLVDHERQTVEVGPLEQILTAERLSRLYGEQVRVEQVGGHRTVLIDRRRLAETTPAHEPRGAPSSAPSGTPRSAPRSAPRSER